mmetsp:Transcript_32668/g.93262  ORF Transcript_32668/g.93262 Transcript_32668/m.93262 type:complete len:427 (-) Transcript_32668:1242-2522(-)
MRIQVRPEIWLVACLLLVLAATDHVIGVHLQGPHIGIARDVPLYATLAHVSARPVVVQSGVEAPLVETLAIIVASLVVLHQDEVLAGAAADVVVLVGPDAEILAPLRRLLGVAATANHVVAVEILQRLEIPPAWHLLLHLARNVIHVLGGEEALLLEARAIGLAARVRVQSHQVLAQSAVRCAVRVGPQAEVPAGRVGERRGRGDGRRGRRPHRLDVRAAANHAVGVRLDQLHVVRAGHLLLGHAPAVGVGAARLQGGVEAPLPEAAAVALASLVVIHRDQVLARSAGGLPILVGPLLERRAVVLRVLTATDQIVRRLCVGAACEILQHLALTVVATRAVLVFRGIEALLPEALAVRAAALEVGGLDAVLALAARVPPLLVGPLDEGFAAEPVAGLRLWHGWGGRRHGRSGRGATADHVVVAGHEV